MNEPTSASALGDIRVLDLTGPIGQSCGRLLADLGADVLKVEPPAGDPGRSLAPFAGDQPGPERSLFFLHFNANKRGIVLDLEHDRGRSAFLDLVRDADVLLESFPTGTLERLALGYDDLRLLNPRLVFTSVTPFGRTGPHRDFKGNDLIGVATGGMLYINGEPQRPPVTSPLEQAYQMVGLHAALGTLLALLERRHSGLGQQVDVSMQDVQAHMFFNVVNYAANNDIPLRLGERGAIVPNGVYPAKDGHVSLSIFQPRHWPLLVEWMADPVLADPGWEERELRRENGDLIDARIAEFTSGFTVMEFVAEGQRRHIPVGPIHTTADFVASPHVAERGIFVELEHPVLGRYRAPGPSLRMSATPPKISSWEAGARGWRSASGHKPAASAPIPDLPSSVANPRRLPLAGIRVVDFSRVWAGPFGARFLGDYGADVIRVESVKFPDMRATPGLPPRVRRERDAHFAEMHRNKRSVTLDLHAPRGRDLALRLIGEADVVVENFGLGVMERWGLGYADLRTVKPDVIMVGMPGLGSSGPHSTYLAYGQQLMGYLGLSPLWRQPESPMAASCKLAYPDFIAAGQLAAGVTAALLHRERTGEGQYIEVAQIDAVASAMGVAFLDYFLNGRVWEACGNVSPNYAPHGVYRCLGHDRWVAIACETEGEWRDLCAAIGSPDLATDPRFATRALRHEHRTALDPLIEAWTEGQTPHQVMERLQRAGVPAGVVATSEDLYHDEHLRGRGFLVTIDHPEPGRIDHPGMTARLAATPGCIRRPAPLLGEHNDEIFLGLLRLSRTDYEELIAEGVIA